jgi:hypothetical protein
MMVMLLFIRYNIKNIILIQNKFYHNLLDLMNHYWCIRLLNTFIAWFYIWYCIFLCIIMYTHVVYSLHNQLVFHTVAYVLVTTQDLQISNRCLVKIIFSTQALNVVYLFVCFHYFTKPTDFSRCIFLTQAPNIPYFSVCCYATSQDLLISHVVYFLHKHLTFHTLAYVFAT